MYYKKCLLNFLFNLKSWPVSWCFSRNCPQSVTAFRSSLPTPWLHEQFLRNLPGTEGKLHTAPCIRKPRPWWKSRNISNLCVCFHGFCNVLRWNRFVSGLSDHELVTYFHWQRKVFANRTSFGEQKKKSGSFTDVVKVGAFSAPVLSLRVHIMMLASRNLSEEEAQKWKHCRDFQRGVM